MANSTSTNEVTSIEVSPLTAALNYLELGDWAFSMGYSYFNEKNWEAAKNWYLISQTFFARSNAFLLMGIDQTIEAKKQEKN